MLKVSWAYGDYFKSEDQVDAGEMISRRRCSCRKVEDLLFAQTQSRVCRGRKNQNPAAQRVPDEVKITLPPQVHNSARPDTPSGLAESIR